MTLALAVGLPANAEQSAFDRLYDAIGMPQMIQTMHQEGVAYSVGIGEDLFPTRAAGTEWHDIVARIYAPGLMTSRVRADFATALDGEDLAPMLAFFESDLGNTIVGLEVSARRAMLDEAIDDAAREAAALAAMDDTPRHRQITRFSGVNDLIESNVVGGLNANYAFYLGLLDGGALSGELTTDQILSDVWAQEEDIRVSTTEWIYSFLGLAYQPLSDAELDAYIAFSETPAGQVLNRALFAAFDGMFIDINRALGLGAARMMLGADL